MRAAARACWLCALLDLVSALALSSLPSRTPLQQQPHPEDSPAWTSEYPRAGRYPHAPKPPSSQQEQVRDNGLFPLSVQQQHLYSPLWARAFRTSEYPRAGRYPRAVKPPSSNQALARDRNLFPVTDHRSEVLRFIDKVANNFPENCSQKLTREVLLPEWPRFVFKARHFRHFSDQARKAVQLANVLNSLFLHSRHAQHLYKNFTYFAMTQTLVQNDPEVKGCGIVFQMGQYRPLPANTRPYFFPYSYRAASGATIVSDLSRFYEPFNTSWFYQQSRKDPTTFLRPAPTGFTNASDVANYSGKVESWWSKIAHVTEKDGYWAQPYFDCLLNAWIVQYSVPFYEMQASGKVIFKGVVLLDLDLSYMEVNQCQDGDSDEPFSGTHRCRQESTQCVHKAGNGLSWGSYDCECKPEFYFPERNVTNRSFHGREVEQAYLDWINNRSLNYTKEFMCLPCRKGCEKCEGDDPCIVEFDVLLRGIPLGIQSFCMTIALVVGIVIARLRKTKVMRSSVWVLLEMIVLGALLLYATVVIQYFEPTATNCLLVPWFREVGFAILYGTLLLKIYRILAEFQSRKAHRVHVRDKDLFKSLAVMLVVVVGYMAAWTAVNVDHLATGTKLIDTDVTDDKLSYVLCKSLWWDYAIEMAELMFLGVGVYLSYCVRAAPSDYSEGRYVTVAICYELVFSTIFYVLKHLWWLKLHPDYLFLMYFLRCQLTVTINLLILLGPKLWYAHRPPDDDRMRTRAYSQSDVQDSTAPETMKLNVGISSNGDVDVGEISLTEMDPEDIRAELKRLYTQLQIYKTKTMRKDNPHISKRRGGRKTTHRRFSLQAFHHKHRHHHDHDHEHEMSKTPEESTNSAEAMTFAMEPSVKEEPNEGASTGGSAASTATRTLPSVSFKAGHT